MPALRHHAAGDQGGMSACGAWCRHAAEGQGALGRKDGWLQDCSLELVGGRAWEVVLALQA